MCLQCVTEALDYGEVVPGFSLMKAQKPDPDWTVWGLVEINDPTFTWDVDPVADPDLLERRPRKASLEALQDEFARRWDLFDKQLRGRPEAGHRLVLACVKAGYKQRKHTSIARFLLHRCGVLVQETKPVFHGDR